MIPASRRRLIVLYVIVAALLAAFLISVSIYLCYGFSDRLGRALGPTAMNVIVRLSAFLLVCIGVQIMWNGIRALLEAVQFHVH